MGMRAFPGLPHWFVLQDRNRPQASHFSAILKKPGWDAYQNTEVQTTLDEFSYSVLHIPGKDLNTADTLSRLPDLESDSTAVEFQKEVEAYVYQA